MGLTVTSNEQWVAGRLESATKKREINAWIAYEDFCIDQLKFLTIVSGEL